MKKKLVVVMALVLAVVFFSSCGEGEKEEKRNAEAVAASMAEHSYTREQAANKAAIEGVQRIWGCKASSGNVFEKAKQLAYDTRDMSNFLGDNPEKYWPKDAPISVEQAEEAYRKKQIEFCRTLYACINRPFAEREKAGVMYADSQGPLPFTDIGRIVDSEIGYFFKYKKLTEADVGFSQKQLHRLLLADFRRQAVVLKRQLSSGALKAPDKHLYWLVKKYGVKPSEIGFTPEEAKKILGV